MSIVMPKLTFTTDTRSMERWTKDVIDKLEDAVKRTALRVVAHAKLDAPVDTGALRESIHAQLIDADMFAESVAAAQRAFNMSMAARKRSKKKGQKTTLPIRNELKILDDYPRPENSLEAFVVAPVEYAIYQEFGTIHMFAQPFLSPAIERSRKKFEDDLRNVLREAGI